MIFYNRGDRGTLFKTVIATRPGLTLSNDTALPFNVLLGRGPGGTGRDADIMPDGKRFVVVPSGSMGAIGIRQFDVITNWFEELKQRVPAN